MDRLKDLKDSTEDDIAFAAKVAETQAPSVSDPFMKKRVRAEIASKRRKPKWVLKPLVAGFAVLLFISSASAMFGRHAIARFFGLGQSTPEIQRTTKGPHDSSSTHGPTVVIEPPVAPAPPLPPPDVPLPPLKSSAPFVTAAPHPQKRAGKPPADEKLIDYDPAKDETRESLLMVPAFRALHDENDPALTLEFLNDYFKKFPSGALYEEALALKIEALVSAKDPAARKSADAYLKRYPLGRFRRVAFQAQKLFP